ncbi:tripartite tricarboxylate transporter substrate binding protein [Diaphorobacter aerolatus]|uniref:Tripartite tricarboxylate transporter substrate binding protein n=1 Tax=Diaphorobacter aerolatus TaxID=1288495 RepID=A0A7H0GL54_9BURK|nr:tripartite tricarboxylate transporter substrate binding protein [Diaphorobacter aerolatus]QNP49020.1 tripartite tricarboxylate transporter substrate binding protein [Diaphorobacter aerolatus]
MVVPFPPGGSSDAIARMLADGMGKELGTTVYVDNRPGAATNIGSEFVVKSKADGYTLLFGGSTLIVNSIFGPKPSFDPQVELEPLSTVAEVPFVLATQPDAPFKTPRDFLEASRSEPGKLTIASAQLDTFVERLKLAASIDLLHVPYRGGAQAVSDAISGQVDTTFALMPVLLPMIQSGKLRALGITSAKRQPTLPNVPTFTESGVNIVMTVWYGLQAPDGVASERRELLNKAVRKVVDAPEFSARLAEMGARASSSSAVAMQQLLARQRKAWEQLAVAHPQLLQSSKP